MRCASAAITRRGSGRWLLAALALAGLLAGCSNPREAELGRRGPCPSYEQQVGPLLEQNCGSCHGEATAEAGYRVDTYFLTVRPREDGTPRVEVGEEDSLFIRAVRGELAGHPELSDGAQRTLEDWVLSCETERKDLVFHEGTWMNPWNEGFHGRFLRHNGYELESCTECHGADLSGGSSQVACSQCHADNQPLNSCSTCHGGNGANPAPPRDLEYLEATTRLGVGAHQVHLTDGRFHKAYGCEVCHLVPSAPGDDGHYRQGSALDVSEAEVILTSGKSGEAAWNRGEATCANSGCHAPVEDANATNQTPVWTKVGEGQADCGTCHGLPPATHTPGLTECVMCHRPGFIGTELNLATHVNGQVELSFVAGQCVGCHGSGTQPAPPVDLQGNTSPTVKTVGAHRAHLDAQHLLRGPIACTECHQVPQTIEEPGHLDSTRPAEVFPAVAGVGVTANARGGVSTYDAATGTCTTYCHGSTGGTLPTDTRANNQTPLFTQTTAEAAACGSCHGLPPATSAHPQNVGLNDCATCHARTITPQGAIIIRTDMTTGLPTSSHIDGDVDLATAP